MGAHGCAGQCNEGSHLECPKPDKHCFYSFPLEGLGAQAELERPDPHPRDDKSERQLDLDLHFTPRLQIYGEGGQSR